MNIKAILPLLVLLILGGAAYFFLTKEDKNTANKNEDWIMHIEDPSQVERVFIADRKGGIADIKREGDHWIYNDKYRANPYVMGSVLEALTKIRMKNRPTSTAIPSMVKVLATHSTKVEVYGKNDKLLKAFYVGGVTQDERGTFMIQEGSNNPYVMHMPMAEISLKQRFFTGEAKWRDKTIFSIQPDEVLSLSIEYPKRKNKSFKLTKNKSTWKVEPFYATTKRIDKKVNHDIVETYLSTYKKIGAEAIEYDKEYVKDVVNKQEFCIVKLLLKDATEKQVNFFPIIKYEDEEETQPMPIERYIAVDETKTIYLTQHLVFKDIFWAYDYFFEGN